MKTVTPGGFTGGEGLLAVTVSAMREPLGPPGPLPDDLAVGNFFLKGFDGLTRDVGSRQIESLQ